MKTATAATPASQQRGAADRQAAGRRLKELAANLDVHRGFADVIASLEAGHGGALGGVWGASRALGGGAVAASFPGVFARAGGCGRGAILPGASRCCCAASGGD